MTKLPVFLHIPKNAGTYVLSWIMIFFRFYGISSGWNDKYGWNLKLRRIAVTFEEKVILTVFVYDKHDVCITNKSFVKDKTDQYCNYIPLFDFLIELLNNKLLLFSVIVEARGFYLYRQGVVKLICGMSNAQPIDFAVFREPFARAKSMYNYLTSSASSHESTHKTIIANSFEEYLNSYQLEDSWLIRNLLNIKNDKAIQDTDLKLAYKTLQSVKIKDISRVDNLIDEVFLECYSLNQKIVPEKMIDANKNKSGAKKEFSDMSLDSLEEQTKQKFLNRTKYENQLYSMFCLSSSNVS